MARKSNSNDGNGLEEALAKGLGSLSSDSEVLKDNTKEIKSGVNSLKNSASTIKKTLNEISKSSTSSEGELKEIGRDTKEMRSSLKNIAEALKKSSGVPVQDPAGMREPGSKVMGMAPSTTKQSTALTIVPGSKIAETDKGSTALIAQGKENTEATKNLGNKITNFFSGKVFFGKLLGTIVDGIIGSKLLSNTLMDVFKLGVYLFASAMRTLFGKHFGGITALLLTILGSLKGLKSLGQVFKVFRKTGSFKMAGKAGFRELFKLPFGLNKITKGFKLPKIGSKTATAITGEGVKLLEDEALKKGATAVVKKGVGKALTKKIPGVSIGAGLLFGAQRAMEGDWVGAGGELASGVAGTFAGPGTAASLGIDAWLMKRDFDRASGKESDDKFIKSMLKMTYSIQKIVNPIVAIADIIKKIWDWINGGPFSSNGEGRSWGDRIHDLLTPSGDLTSDGRIKGTGEDASKILQSTRKEKESHSKADKLVSKLFPGHSITSYFGRRVDPLNKSKIEDHHGIDVTFGKGQSVPAAIGGKVVWSQFEGTGTTGYGNKGYGNTVEILDENTGITYRYHHLSSLGVKAGQYVKRGQAIGVAGSTSSTGRSTGVHLDWEARRKGQFINPAEAAAESLEYEVKSKDSIPTPAVVESSESKKEHERQIEWLKKQGYTSEQAKMEVYGVPMGGAANIEPKSSKTPNDRISSNSDTNAVAKMMQLAANTQLMLRTVYGDQSC